MKPSVLVIGYGSTLRGDDAVGPRAAELLAERFSGRPEVLVRAEPSLTPELSAEIAAVDRVVLIDCAADLACGEVAEFSVDCHDDDSPAMVHFLNPSALIRWTRRLYGVNPEAVQFAIGGGSFEINDGLTPPVAMACAAVVERVGALLEGWLFETEAVRA